MKAYSGTRRLDGEAFVVVRTVAADGRSHSHPLTHISYHSPSGLNWGYAGSGPADLALAILADYFQEQPELVLAALRSMWAPRSKAAALHQAFKEQFVAREQGDQWQLGGDAIDAWLQAPSIQDRLTELAEEDAELAEIRRLAEEAERAEADAAGQRA